MPTFASFADFGREIDGVVKELELVEKKRITHDMGQRAQAIAEAAASSDLGGDPKFSGWAPRLDTQLKSIRDGGTVMMPTRSGAGPWTVAQFGRNQGNASGFSGPGLNSRTGKTSRTKSGGLRKVRAFKTKRWNGTTKGKNTADNAIARMDRELPKIAEDGVRKVLKRHFDVD